MNDIPPLLDALVAFLLVVGAVFALIGAYALLKLGDFMKRLHGPSIATTLGVGCVLSASTLWFALSPGTPLGREILIAVFLFASAPVSSHWLILAALRLERSARANPEPVAAARGERSM